MCCLRLSKCWGHGLKSHLGHGYFCAFYYHNHSFRHKLTHFGSTAMGYFSHTGKTYMAIECEEVIPRSEWTREIHKSTFWEETHMLADLVESKLHFATSFCSLDIWMLDYISAWIFFLTLFLSGWYSNAQMVAFHLCLWQS